MAERLRVMDQVLDGTGRALDALRDACAAPDANVGALLRAAELQIGDIPVRSILPKLWCIPAAREPILDYLYASCWYEEYLRRTRDYVVERIEEGDPLPHWYLDRYAAEHLFHGQGEAFLGFMERIPAIRGRSRVGGGRILASLGRIDEAKAVLAGSPDPLNFGELFALGWIEHHFGDKAAAGRLRDKWNAILVARVRRQLDAWSPDQAAAAIAAGARLAEAVPFLDAALAGHDQVLAAEVAGASRRLIAAGATRPDTVPCQGPLTIGHWDAAGAAERAEAAARGLNICALALMTADNEAIEIMADSRAESEALAARLPRLSDEDHYQGFWGQPQVEVARPIHMLRGIGMHGAMRALCPWSGRPVASTQSLCFGGLYAYRFEGLQVFWIISAPLLCHRSWLWCPEEDLLIGLRPAFSTDDMRNRLLGFQAHLAIHAEAIAHYIAQPRRLAVLTGLELNIGHHYLNELSGVYRVASNRILEPEIGLSGPQDHYDCLELFGLGRHIVQLPHPAALPEFALREGLFVVYPTDFAAQRGLAERLLAEAHRRPPSVALQAALGGIADADLVLVVGLRSKRRVWLDGPASIADILARLERGEEFGRPLRVAVVFDGFTRTAAGGVEEDTFIEQENAEIAKLQARPDFVFQGPIVSAVGLTLYEKALLFSQADLTISPKGNGHQPTLSWLTRTPSVVHSNSFEISAAAGENAICDDAAPATVLDKSAINDALTPYAPWNRYADQRGFAFEDYQLDRDRVWAAVERVAKAALARRHTGTAARRP